MNNKMLATLLVGKIKAVLKSTEEANKALTKDKTLEDPIISDVVLSNKAYAYDNILAAFKEYMEKKKELKEQE